jgi:alpha-amylase
MRRATLSLLLLVGCTSVTSVARKAGETRAAPPADWWNGAVVYELFVRSFQDSNGDGKGDLRGLIQRLDYLNDGDPSTTSDLGVDAIWLMPVFASPSYHGYDTSDYDAINRDYGTGADLDELLRQAHRRGIKVIVDLVINHVSSQHPWFREAVRSPTSPHRSWFVWSETDPGWKQPFGDGPTWHPGGGQYYYGVFWGGMPDLNWREPAVRAELDRVAKAWLDRGVDGFRLDAVRYLVEDGPGQQADRPDTHAVLKAFAAGVRAARPGALLVGEAWADTDTIAAYYGDTSKVPGGDELPLLFDFPLAGAIVAGVTDGSAGFVAATLAEVQRTYPPGAVDAPFLTNHDQIRLATQLGHDLSREKLAAAVLLTLPGTPFLYYGEELGLQNGPGTQDESKRTPMPWDGTASAGFSSTAPWYELAPDAATANVAAETGEPGSLLSRYRDLIRLRHGSPALQRGALGLLSPGSDQVLAFTRTLGAETVLVVHNFGGSPITAGPLGAPGRTATPLLVDPGGALSGAPDARTVSLPARGTGVWRLAP